MIFIPSESRRLSFLMLTRQGRPVAPGLSIAVIVVGLLAPGMAAAQVAVRGRVIDAHTREPIRAAQITLLPLGQDALSDVDGAFAFDVDPHSVARVRVVRMGYAPWERELRLDGGEPAESLEVALVPRPAELGGLTVVGEGKGALVRFPGSATLIDAQELRATRPFSGNESFKLVTGVHVQEEEGGGFRANIGMRGLDPDRSRTVLVLEDGVPVALAPYGEPEMYYTPPIDRMERVELLKGSGSILFGPQTVGGVINYVTADPPLTPRGRLALMGGSGAFGMANLSYGGTWSAAGFQGGLLRRQAENIRGLTFEQTDVTVKAALTLGANDVLGLKLGVYDESSNSTYVGLTDSIFRVDPSFYPGADDRLAIRRYSASLSHERSFARGSAVKTVAYAYQTIRNWRRQDYQYTQSGNSYLFLNSAGNRNRRFEVAGLEPRFRIAHGLGEFEGGVRAHYERAFEQRINGETATSSSGAIRDDEVRTGYAFAAFAQNRFAITDRLRVTVGGRVEFFTYNRRILRTRVRRDVRDASGEVVGTTRVAEDVDLRSGDKLVAVIPGVGVSWFAGSHATLFVGVHRGFAPPRVKDALIYSDEVLPPDQQPGDPVSLELDAEESWNFEVGTRSQPIPGLFVEVTGFYLDFSNQIVEPSLSAGTAGQVQLANQGATRHRGVESALGVDWGLLAGWSWSFRTDMRYTYSDARFARDRFIQAPSGDTVNVNGNRLPYAPEHLVALSALVTLPSSLTLKVDAVRVSEQFADNFETATSSPNGRNGAIPAQTVWNVAGSYHIPGTRISAVGSVKNLFDNLYVASRRPEGIKPGLFRQVNLGFDWDF